MLLQWHPRAESHKQRQYAGHLTSIIIAANKIIRQWMLGFTPVPQPSENRKIREIVVRTNYLWSNFKEPPQQQSLALRQLNTLFHNSLAKLGKELKPVLEDIDVQQQKPMGDDLISVSTTTINRTSLYKQVADRLIRSQLYRNQEIKRTVEEYSREYDQRHQENVTIEVEQDKPSSTTGLAPFQQRYSVRPRTTPVSQRFSRSLIIERKQKTKEEIITAMGLNIGLTETTKIHAPMFQCRGITPNPKNRHQATHNSLSGSKHIDMFNIEQPNIKLVNPEYPLLHLEEPQVPRVSFIDENRRQFAPAFGQRRHSAFSTTNTAYNKATQVQILKDKIRLLNCEFAIKVTRQQGYKKKMRNPRNLSSIIV